MVLVIVIAMLAIVCINLLYRYGTKWREKDFITISINLLYRYGTGLNATDAFDLSEYPVSISYIGMVCSKGVVEISFKNKVSISYIGMVRDKELSTCSCGLLYQSLI